MMNTTNEVPAKSLEMVLAEIRKGGIAYVPTAWRLWTMDAKTLAKFEKAGTWMLKEDGDGYRMRSGRGSVYLLPGQLRLKKAA